MTTIFKECPATTTCTTPAGTILIIRTIHLPMVRRRSRSRHRGELDTKGNGTQEAQEAQDFFLFLVPLVLLVFRSLLCLIPPQRSQENLTKLLVAKQGENQPALLIEVRGFSQQRDDSVGTDEVEQLLHIVIGQVLCVFPKHELNL